jgi:CRP-like cAMP-binding protein
MEYFQNTSWFEEICNQSKERVYKRGEIFGLQGEPLQVVGLVLSGKATAISFSKNGDETWVGEYEEGQFIGLMSLLTNNVSNFEIKAKSKLILRVLSKDKMHELMRENAALCEVVAIDLATRLNSSVSDLVDVHTLSVKGRICAELIRLALPIGIDPDRQIIRPSPIFVELARRLNSSRETVSRTVSELQSKGVVAREPGALIINDLDTLQQVIEFI